jgi:hypothetical protein
MEEDEDDVCVVCSQTATMLGCITSGAAILQGEGRCLRLVPLDVMRLCV